MILKTNLAAHKKTKRHQNAVNPLPSEDSKAAQRAKERLKKVTVREPSYSEEEDGVEDELEDDVEDDDIEDMPFEDEVMAGLELLNNKLDQILALDMGSELRKSNVKFADLVKEMNELSRQAKENNQTTTNLLDNIRIHIIQEMKACQGGLVQFNSKTG
jgi:hypothetical protein